MVRCSLLWLDSTRPACCTLQQTTRPIWTPFGWIFRWRNNDPRQTTQRHGAPHALFFSDLDQSLSWAERASARHPMISSFQVLAQHSSVSCSPLTRENSAASVLPAANWGSTEPFMPFWGHAAASAAAAEPSSVFQEKTAGFHMLPNWWMKPHKYKRRQQAASPANQIIGASSPDGCLSTGLPVTTAFYSIWLATASEVRADAAAGWSSHKWRPPRRRQLSGPPQVHGDKAKPMKPPPPGHPQ